MTRLFITIAGFLLAANVAACAEGPPVRAEDRRPFAHAHWIGFDDPAIQRDARFAFREALEMHDKPASATVRVTADARYILWVNGQFVGRGPARGFPWAQPYDEFDLTPFLRPGTNWIAAEVYQFGAGAGAFGLSDRGNGVYVSTGKTALLIEGEAVLTGANSIPIRTDVTWQARRADWHLSAAIPYLHGAFAFQECVDGRREPSGWRMGLGADGWQNAVQVAAPGDAPWTGFEPRGLKPMRETLLRILPIAAAFAGTNAPDHADPKLLTKLWKEETFDAPISLPRADADGWMQVAPPARGFVALTFDLGWNPAAFPRVEVRGGDGGEILDSGYGYVTSPGESNRPKVLNGACDRFIAASGDSAWQSFLPRGYRYHTVKVRADHPVTMRASAVVVHHDVASALPFECSNEGLAKAWAVTDRTLRATMLDAFVDNNWREQTQWLHDDCVGALGAWATYGDTALWRRLLRQAAQSSRYFPDGAVHSMVACDPAYQSKVMPICDYNLHWLANVDQYYAATKDDGLLREVLPAVRGLVLRHVENGFTAEHLFIQPSGSKLFFDWTSRPWDKRPYSLTLNLTVLRALRAAGRLAKAAGDTDLAAHCQRRGDELGQAIEQRFWSAEHGGWREHLDPPGQVLREIQDSRPADWLEDPWQKIILGWAKDKNPTACTRHGNALAVLLRLGTPEQQASAAKLVVDSFEPASEFNNGMSPLWTDKIFGSLFECGRDAEAIRLLQGSYGTWARNGALHWGEGFGPGDAAQLCGSSINWLLTSYVLGIRPLEPGFAEAVFDPRPGNLASAKGSIPTPHGIIHVEWRQAADGVIDARINAPTTVRVRTASPRIRVQIEPGVNAAKLDAFRSLVRRATWTERWPDAEGKPQPREVMGELWTGAIQAALDKHGAVLIPARREPYYLDAPIVLRSGQSLKADRDAEIRLKPGSNTCMVRNEHVVGFADRPVPEGLEPDTDIWIEGGIWSTLATGPAESNGNARGQSSKDKPVPGTHGVILLHNVRRVTVREITVRQSRPFAVHLGNAREFVVDGVTLDRHGRDGVHVDGPASDGIIRNVSGDSKDDPVSLTAWDWRQYSASFGPIHQVLVERVTGAPSEKRATDAIRLLPGVKRFTDGTTLDCPIHDIVLRDITDIREFKIYDQPNLELGRDRDFSAEIGKLRNIQLRNLTFHRPGVIQVAADVDGLSIEDVDLHFDPAQDFKLVEIGPMSATYRVKRDDPTTWVEIFSPDRDVIVRHFHLDAVRVNGRPLSDAFGRFVQVRDQHLNPDYPKTTPRGGTGKAKIQ